MFFPFILVDVRTGARRTKHQAPPLRWPETDDAIGFGALAEEQLALVADRLLHGISFLVRG